MKEFQKYITQLQLNFENTFEDVVQNIDLYIVTCSDMYKIYLFVFIFIYYIYILHYRAIINLVQPFTLSESLYDLKCILFYGKCLLKEKIRYTYI